VAAARAGAEIVREMYGRRLARIDKGGGDFATTADVASEEAILDVIRAARRPSTWRCTAGQSPWRTRSIAYSIALGVPCLLGAFRSLLTVNHRDSPAG
jgi:hypothetical protein